MRGINDIITNKNARSINISLTVEGRETSKYKEALELMDKYMREQGIDTKRFGPRKVFTGVKNDKDAALKIKSIIKYLKETDLYEGFKDYYAKYYNI